MTPHYLSTRQDIHFLNMKLVFLLTFRPLSLNTQRNTRKKRNKLTNCRTLEKQQEFMDIFLSKLAFKSTMTKCTSKGGPIRGTIVSFPEIDRTGRDQ
jgi:hypothetical protein